MPVKQNKLCFREKIHLRKHWKIRARPVDLERLVDLEEVVDSEKVRTEQERVMNHALQSFDSVNTKLFYVIHHF